MPDRFKALRRASKWSTLAPATSSLSKLWAVAFSSATFRSIDRLNIMSYISKTVVDINRVHEVQFAQVLNGQPCGLVQTDAFEAAWTDEGARRPFHPHSYFLAVGGNTPIKRRYIAASA
jgi:hypothetical protein